MVSVKCLLTNVIKHFSKNVLIPKQIIQTAEKKQVTIVLPYMGMILIELKVELHKTFKQLLPAWTWEWYSKFSTQHEELFQLKRQN